MNRRALLCLAILIALARPLSAADFLSIEAERFDKIDGEVRV